MWFLDDSKVLVGTAKEGVKSHLEVTQPDYLELREYEEADVERVERRRALELVSKRVISSERD